MGAAAILVTWSESLEQIYIPLTHRASIKNLGLIGSAAFKMMLESAYLRDLRQRTNNDIDLWYSYVFIHLVHYN